LANEALEVSSLATATPVARWSKFFPADDFLRVPIQLVREQCVPQETTMTEFDTASRVLFVFGGRRRVCEKLRLQNLNGSGKHS